ncbi:Ig-like domain-containing protein [Caenorhabditis elegans]|uniref:Ig-like domain-containing protein n=1 Tax=Caenorhabditis elegans TaxID=6239 RepID=O76697_CAEEL|nr:Ig-like domain-containing protein [Caenorhabditis elegans]CCD66082.1 Ig-like domain-containing protein [Caenorhabditis elegans]|eukprot:NP_497161.1 2 (Zwei) IG domain protein [Caenorhabditis elegans]
MIILLNALVISFFLKFVTTDQTPNTQIFVGPPSFSIFEQDFYYPGTRLHIECLSISIPPETAFLEYRTKKTGSFVRINYQRAISDDGTFDSGVFYNVSLTEDIEFLCWTRGQGHPSFKHIHVADGPSKAFYNVGGAPRFQKSVYEQDTVNLFCAIPHSAINWKVSWRLENSNSTSDLSVTTLIDGNSKYHVTTVKNITKSGVYTCVIEADKFKERRQLLETVIKVKPASTRPEPIKSSKMAIPNCKSSIEIEIQCNITGHPLPEYSWVTDESSGSTLTISEDSGVFQCIDSKNRYVEVNVTGSHRKALGFYIIVALLMSVTVGVCVFLISERVANGTEKKRPVQYNLRGHFL